RAKQQPAAAPSAPEPQDAVPAPTPAHSVASPYAPHAPRQRPTWVAAHGGDDQTMQIALGGLGGRKE
ncbi:hypothetical protein, partial [Streptomyces spinoverrucosus]